MILAKHLVHNWPNFKMMPVYMPLIANRVMFLDGLTAMQWRCVSSGALTV